MRIFLFMFLLTWQIHVKAQPKGVLPPIKSAITYTASSWMKPSYGLTYEPSRAGDQTLLSWWSPDFKDRETCWLQLNFPSTKMVDRISIHAGSHYPNFPKFGNLYDLNLRIRLAQLEFSDGSVETINLKDVDEVQVIQFDMRVTRYVRIRPLRYFAAYKWNDPCISYFMAGYGD